MQSLGYYLYLSLNNVSVADRHWLNPRLAGIALRRRWSVVEPEAGKFDFSFYKKALEQARKYGKTAHVEVYAGIHSPIAWLRAQGCRMLRYVDEGTAYEMPVPWDSVLQDRLSKLAAAMGQALSVHPEISLVQVPGYRRSSEYHLPDEILQQEGWSPTKMIDCWNKQTRAWAKAFPRTDIMHACSEVCGSNTFNTVARPTAKGAADLLGSRFVLQHSSLKAATKTDANHHALVREYSHNGFKTGYEMWGASSQFGFGGTFDKAVNLCLADGGDYIRMYLNDDRLIKRRVPEGTPF